MVAGSSMFLAVEPMVHKHIQVCGLVFRGRMHTYIHMLTLANTVYAVIVLTSVDVCAPLNPVRYEVVFMHPAIIPAIT